jgi:hypothetical protein
MHFQLGAKQPMVWPSTRMRSGKFAKRVQFVGILRGAGKSHALAALGHELVLHCHAVLWTPTASLVQQLLAAKRDLLLPHLVAKLDRYECVFLDDIGLNEHSAPAAETAARLGGCYRHPARTPAREAIRAKHALGGAALCSTFFGGRFVTQVQGRPARCACAGRDIRVGGRSVIQHAFDSERVVFRLGSNTRHQRVPFVLASGDPSAAFTAASARSADAVAAV